ncbi:hypothetical protein AKJ66_02600 [candidate division MSBL1 archaeon SCGC-AAA259E22]|uniref:Uncharacterized protein n=1 Tax=candidate division MSBL1 archaeon SCGC-AAA259E22 TaxID=1698265 RepID=A0A133UG47_9EURY|nr:hypothetical protein AKJ66_02600 [candidate division MSBL1 archaeon SCGC-AAA259E22]
MVKRAREMELRISRKKKSFRCNFPSQKSLLSAFCSTLLKNSAACPLPYHPLKKIEVVKGK